MDEQTGRQKSMAMQGPMSGNAGNGSLPAESESSAHPDGQGITSGLKIVSYAVNDRGQYELSRDFFWQPVHVVNDQAWQEIARKIALSREKVAAGQVSCLHYYMTANQMNIGLVAQYTGQARWKVLLHLVPLVFRRLSGDTLGKYADLYRVSPDDLRAGRLLAPIYNHE
jgi:hypothetical protein